MTLDEVLYKVFLFWYACGIILLSFDWIPPWLEWANAMFLVLAGLLGVIFFIKKFNWQYGLLISSVIFSSSFLIEYLGSAYSILFGQYGYTEKFAPNLFGVPIAIGFAWLMVMGTSHVLAKKIVPHGGLLYAIVGGCIAVVIDLIIDPVSYKVKQYWLWEETGVYYGIPFSNFVGWFLVAFVLHLFLLFILKWKKDTNQNIRWEKRMVLLFALMIGMFILLGLLGKLWLASSLTALLASFILLLALRRREAT
ncbi:carotenoid biosynthesis protein [Peribacillus sp. NPDC097206]|uniref:carotenoid biosynthesis protein n=1 Tax=unclassified Peribacillus TaxID=2675266 RepID=UPI0038143859